MIYKEIKIPMHNKFNYLQISQKKNTYKFYKKNVVYQHIIEDYYKNEEE